MLPMNDNDPSRTTDLEPSPAPAGPDVTTEHTPGSVPIDRGTAAYVPGQATEPERAAAAVSVPGYEIEAVLGRGGMGVVYKARHLALKRTVALKMILAGGHAGPRELARFRIEAEAVARLQHPHIVQVFEVGEAGGHPYCALEFVAGGNLASRIAGKPLPAREAARLVEALARAMQLAHSRNVVHRDLKPANILVAADGTPKITDFGLARQLDSDSGETQAGAVMGTPSYMAPEQASGRAHEAGPAADIYALGAILYACLTGRPPFQGKTMVETLDQVRTQEPVPPSRWQKSVPLDLETICLKCLRKEPEKRYASAAELADDLVRYQHDEPILARPVGRLERALKWVKRNPVMTVVVAALLLVTVLGVAGIVWKYSDAERQKGIADEQKLVAQGKAQAARQEAEKARDFLVSIFELSDANNRRGTMTARQILDDAEKQIPKTFADQPELQAELLAAIDAVYAKITADSPLAMILVAGGTVQLQSAKGPEQRAVPQALLYGGDRLTLAADARVQLVFLADLHQEWLKSARTVAIRRKGCEPADAIGERSDSVLMTFVHLPRGTFYMGFGVGDFPSPRQGTKTQIKEDFEIAVHAVTQGQWQAVMGDNPSFFSRFGGSRLKVKSISDEELKLFPVEGVNPSDAEEFIKKLNKREQGKGFLHRLPTEAEWEYACRGGAASEEECSYQFYFARPTNDLSSAQANINGKYPAGKALPGKYLERPARVGAYPPNKLGLCDMHGNVWQWCADGPPGGAGHRWLRGGAWSWNAPQCRAASHIQGHDNIPRRDDQGFRLVRAPVR